MIPLSAFDSDQIKLKKIYIYFHNQAMNESHGYEQHCIWINIHHTSSIPAEIYTNNRFWLVYLLLYWTRKGSHLIHRFCKQLEEGVRNDLYLLLFLHWVYASSGIRYSITCGTSADPSSIDMNMSTLICGVKGFRLYTIFVAAQEVQYIQLNFKLYIQ